MPIESYYIYSLYQAGDSLLYIGTNNAGLLIYDIRTSKFERYYTENSALISNNIYDILSDGQDNIFLSTESGLSNFSTVDKTFHNWTKEHGLKSDHFNASSGTLRKTEISFSEARTVPSNSAKTLCFPVITSLKWY